MVAIGCSGKRFFAALGANSPALFHLRPAHHAKFGLHREVGTALETTIHYHQLLSAHGTESRTCIYRAVAFRACHLVLPVSAAHGLLEHGRHHHPQAGTQTQAHAGSGPAFSACSSLLSSITHGLCRFERSPTAMRPLFSSINFCTSAGGVMELI